MLELGKTANVEIARFVHAEDAAFRIRNRRNKGLGLWAASQLDPIEGASDYANTIVAFGLDEPDDEILIRHVQAELSQRGVPVSETAIRYELVRQTTLAVQECIPVQPP